METDEFQFESDLVERVAFAMWWDEWGTHYQDRPYCFTGQHFAPSYRRKAKVALRAAHTLELRKLAGAVETWTHGTVATRSGQTLLNAWDDFWEATAPLRGVAETA